MDSTDASGDSAASSASTRELTDCTLAWTEAVSPCNRWIARRTSSGLLGLGARAAERDQETYFAHQTPVIVGHKSRPVGFRREWDFHAGFGFERQEQTLKLIAQAFGGDPACTDRNRVLRVPGFLNRKYSPSHPVAVEYPADAIYGPADFQLDAVIGSSVLPLRRNARKSPPAKHSHSEDDWAWVCEQLAHGTDASKLTWALAQRRADKSDPLYYAQRTVDVASARLWLDQGIPIDDIITMLEVRRRFEISAALCSARAREIAATAQRMIARRKTA